ncbi:hypothetical protein AAHH67_09490 [Niallia circulans]
MTVNDEINSLVDGSNVNQREGGLHMKIKPVEWLKLNSEEKQSLLEAKKGVK